MTVAPHSPLVAKVGQAILDTMFWQFGILKIDPEKAARAALDSSHAEEMREAIRAAHAHTLELRDAWERGAISEHDGKGGTRSNRNVDIEVQLRALLAKLDGRS